MPFSDPENVLQRVHRAIETLRQGGMVVMVDDEDRENEGDLVLAADHATPQVINFMAKEARGLICLTLEPGIVDHLKLPMMEDTTKTLPEQRTAFTVSIEAREGVTTGISAADRAQTIKVAISPETKPNDIVVPGHIFPLKARPGGVLERAGHTEGSVDLARLAGCTAAGVICEIMNDDGTMARMGDLEEFSQRHNIPMVAIADLINYRLQRESLVEVVKKETVQTSAGSFEGVLFRNIVDKTHHFALVKGENFSDKLVDVRVHSQRPLVDVFGHNEEGSRFRLESGLRMLADTKHGVLVYLCNVADMQNQFARDIDALHEDTVSSSSGASAATMPMDLRLHGTGAQILRALGIKRMRLHTTSARTLKGLSGFGIEVVETCILKKSKS